MNYTQRRLTKFKNFLNVSLIIMLIIFFVYLIGLCILILNIDIDLIFIAISIVSVLIYILFLFILSSIVLCVETLINHDVFIEKAKDDLPALNYDLDNRNIIKEEIKPVAEKKKIDNSNTAINIDKIKQIELQKLREKLLEQKAKETQKQHQVEERPIVKEKKIINPNLEVNIEQIESKMFNDKSLEWSNKYNNVETLLIPDDFDLITAKQIKYKISVHKDKSDISNNYLLTNYSIYMLLINSLNLSVADSKELLLSRMFEEFQIVSGKYEDFIDKISGCNDETKFKRLIQGFLYELSKEIVFLR